MASIKSPYLENGARLADVIAAIQVMGAYPWASREVSSWAIKLGESVSADGWHEVFREHPEFFRLNGEWASLRWRHGYDRSFDAERGIELARDAREALSEQARQALTRRPLSADQIETLLKTAVELHTRAIAQAQERRWLWPSLFGIAGVLLGAVLQAALR
ncbi:hypothetical protein ACUN9Y_20835 [Halomonas sp. V046]|uniref:hypothetical protein n=1 Tax=Halomonas sp. V046 TaxID=3459611 RepID=UPI0040448F7E